MRLLLDTHVAAWWWNNDQRIAAASSVIESAEEVYVSAVSVFEMATKHRIGKWPQAGHLLDRMEDNMRAADFRHLPLTAAHSRAAGVRATPHRDPFDRLLAGQSEVEQLTLVSADPAFADFQGLALWPGPWR